MKLKIKSLKLKVIVAFFLFLLAFEVSAQSIFTKNLGESYPGIVFTVTTLVSLISRLICYLIRFAIIAVLVAFIIYGLMFLKSRGSPQEFGGAKKAFIWGLVGGLVIFGVFTIILSVANIIGTNDQILKLVRCP